MSATPEPKTIFVKLSAQVLHAFAPILRSAADQFDRFYDGAFFAFPHPDGVLCIATDGVVMAAHFDRQGSANQPAQFVIPEHLLAACKPPEPILGYYQGDEVSLRVPEWMLPNGVYLSSHGAFVGPAMPHPDDAHDPENSHCICMIIADDGTPRRPDGYRAQPPRFDPRKVLAKLPDEEAPGPMHLNPFAVSRFVDCFEVFGLKGAVQLTKHVGEAPVSLLFHACPDFIGLIMPMKADAAFARPAFMSALRPSDNAAPEPEPARDAA